MWSRNHLVSLLFGANRLRPRGSAHKSNGRKARRLSVEALEDRSLLSGYSITSLGSLTAYGLNNSGQVVGSNANGAIIWQNGATTHLGAGAAMAINDAGQVAGYSGSATQPHAFLWDQSHGFTNLGALGSDLLSQAADLNESAQVVGLSRWNDYNYQDNDRAFLWDSTSGMQALNSFGRNVSTATAINDAGQVVG